MFYKDILSQISIVSSSLASTSFSDYANKQSNKYDIYHKVTNFVDNSNYVIEANTKEDPTKYINEYFKLLKAYYSVLKLQINMEKQIF